MAGLVLAVLALWPLVGKADFTGCEALFPGQVVPSQQAQSTLDLCKTADDTPLFAVRFDTTRKIPVWTAHSLSPAQMAKIQANRGKMNRPKFTPDPNIPGDQQAVDRSYVRSGFSRGHVVPANDMSWSLASYNATFHFSNVVPQKQRFNAGSWLGAEDAFRAWVSEKNLTFWGFSGVYGTLEDVEVSAASSLGLAPNTPTIPKCFYKIIAAQQSDGQPYKVMALIFKWNNFSKRGRWTDAITTLATVQTRTGIDFLQGLDIESDFDPDFWGATPPATPADCP